MGKDKKMRQLLLLCLFCFPLLASGQSLLGKLYNMTDVLHREIWEQAGVADSVPDSMSGWPDFVLDSLDWGAKDWKYDILQYGQGVTKTYCPAYQVYAFIGDKAESDAARLDANEVLCRWNEHRTVIQHYERGCFPGIGKQQMLNSLQRIRQASPDIGQHDRIQHEHSLFVAWLKPDFVMDLSFLYYGDTLKYWNPEEWRWNKGGVRPNEKRLLCPDRHKRTGRHRRRRGKCYNSTIIEMKAGRLYVKDTMVYSGFEIIEEDSIRLIPWQETLDKVYPSFAKHFNGLERWRSIRPSQRERIVEGRFLIGDREKSQEFWEDWFYNGRCVVRSFPYSDQPGSKDKFPVE